MKPITTLIIPVIAFFVLAFTIKNYNQKSVHDFTLKTIEGKDLNLSSLKGKKLLIVNVASQCGFTPQYKNLQALSDKYKDKLAVIGFPANNFGSQEPGSNTEIKSFCTKNYGVTFTMMEKISVSGEDMHPLYKFLSTKDLNGTVDKAPNWNFCKYLIDENGKVIKFFPSKVDPLSEDIISLL
ncbi:MAG: glutathione peroxidase [Bacteroidetes bacterium]|jgi:glutathione peroxidase|nr:glutathione peroxidase [Bacteroidota bacterium]MCA6443542.1 glutathione peroxidase [Bacteroidota bacterium]